MAYTIAVAGKGGTGKTTFASLVIRYLRQKQGGPILAVDADPNANLNATLGLKLPSTIGDLLEETKGMRELPSGMTKELYLEYRIQGCLLEAEGMDLLVMGRPEGPGCYCYANLLLRNYLDKLNKGYKYVVIDNEAGMEHLSRKTTRNVDLLFIASDPTPVGIHTAQRINELARKLELTIRDTYLIINKLDGDLPEALKEVIEKSEIKLSGTIPFDQKIVEYEMKGEPLLALPVTSPVVKAVDKILKELGL